MASREIRPYGSWPSPIDASAVVAGATGLSQLALDGDDAYWIEARPAEAGRNVVVLRSPDGTLADVIPPGHNARSRVHEYGGGAFAAADRVVWYSNDADRRVYRCAVGAESVPITPEGSTRYADFALDTRRRRLLCVAESHGQGAEPRNTLVALHADLPGQPETVASGADFYSSPRISAAGDRVAWLEWNHPDMPWDGTVLKCARIDAQGRVADVDTVAGGRSEALFQPVWSPDGILHFVSDRSGYWNLYRYADGEVRAVCPMRAEFGRPHWVFGLSTYAFESATRIVAAFCREGLWRIGTVDASSGGPLRELPTPFTEFAYVRARPGRIVACAGGPADSEAIVEIDLSAGTFQRWRGSSAEPTGADWLSAAEPMSFPTRDGGRAHALFYPPRNPTCAGPHGSLPPLLVVSHGGPTSAASSTLNAALQFWTSRGFAVVDVNYGGSTGFGRAYRQRLDGRWGIVDVQDCIDAARYLADSGRVDRARLAIRGRSAGGYTTLAALTGSDVFRAGASYYGVSDLEALAKDTHKFESRYLDRLVGPYPQARDEYARRSPIHAVDRLSAPIIFLQGLEDRVVPPDQAERMVEALRAKGIPVAYLAFPGEQHGFRQAANIRRALEAELYFYSRVFGFGLAEPIEPVPIDHLPPA